MSTACNTPVLYVVASIKSRIVCEFSGLAEAIAYAQEQQAEYQPALGTEVRDLSHNVLFSTEWTAYQYATDGDSGTIYAEDFDAACEQLEEMFSQETIEDGAWGWVQDVDGIRYRVAPENMP